MSNDLIFIPKSFLKLGCEGRKWKDEVVLVKAV